MFPVQQTQQENPAVGNHLGILSWIVLLGTQQTTFNGEAKEAMKISLGFELPDQLYTKGQMQGQAMLVRNQWTLSSHARSGLRQMLESWLGAFDGDDVAKETLQNLHTLMGTAALVNIAVGENGFANIASLTPPINGMQIPAPSRIPILFTMEEIMWNPTEADVARMTEDQYDVYNTYGPMKAVFDNLPERTKLTIAKSPEFININGGPLIIPGQQQQRPQAQRAVQGQRPGIVRAGQPAQAQRPAAPVVQQRPVQHVAQPQQAYRPVVGQPAPVIQQAQQPQRQAFAQPAARQVAPQRQAFQAPQRQIAADQSGDPNPFAGAPSDDDVPV